jgi:chromate reductase, NAD(P)H dehydrogenase (quinone)
MHHYEPAVFVGSLSRESLNRKVAFALAQRAPEALKPSANAAPFASSEYKRSVPGLLKDAIGIGARPYGQRAWDGKPAAVRVAVEVVQSGLSDASRKPVITKACPFERLAEAHAFIHANERAGKVIDRVGEAPHKRGAMS